MHTKGPWIATEGVGVDNYPDWNVRDSNGWLITTCPSEANARLIAAAPELLDALETFILCHAEGGYVKPNDDVFEKAFAAIRKAKGE